MHESLFERFEGKKTLITGETGSGKTKLIAEVLLEAIERVHADDITVLDFAPAQISFRGLRVGGRVKDFLPDLKCHAYRASDSIRAPRLEGHDANEVWKLAEHNASLTSDYIRSYLASLTPYLFVNDLTIHLHAGDVDLLLEAIRKSRTFVGNAYSGTLLKDDRGTGVFRRERQQLSKVAAVVDMIVNLAESGEQAARSAEHNG